MRLKNVSIAGEDVTCFLGPAAYLRILAPEPGVSRPGACLTSCHLMYRYPLNLPEFEFAYQKVGETQMIYDPLRRQYVKLTPEEWVRQHFVQYLIQDRGYPGGLVAVEHAFTFRKMSRRADVVAHDRSGAVVLVAECKAPAVGVTQRAFDQIGRYNVVLQARHLAVTNGREHFCCRVDLTTGACTFLNEIPHFSEITQ